MSIRNLPWLELTILIPLAGGLIVSRFRRPYRDFYVGTAFTGLTLLCALAAWAQFEFGVEPISGLQDDLFGGRLFALDQFSAPLVAVVALLHFLVAFATTRTKMRRFSFTWSLAFEAVRLATFGASPQHPWLLVALLSVGTVPPYIELRNQGRPARMYVLHLSAFVVLLIGGWFLVESMGAQSGWATLPLLLAVLIHLGAFPTHGWVTDWLENTSLGNALLYVVPLAGVLATVRLVLPTAPDWAIQSISVVSLATAIYAAAMATIQRDTRRFFAFVFLSQASSVMIGLELGTAVSLTGSLCLWLSVTISLLGFGLVLRGLEARFGRLPLTRYHGLYEHSPLLAISFLLMGLGCVGFPGTFGYVASELLVDGAIGANIFVGLAVVIASALNGIAIVRAYFLLFTGTRHVSTVSLDLVPRERIAIMTLVVLILLGGLFPQAITESRHRAAEAILANRLKQAPSPLEKNESDE